MTDLPTRYRQIFEISQQLSTTYDYTILLKKIVDAAKDLISTEATAILLLDETTKQLRFAMSSNIKPHEMEQIVVPLEGSIAGWILIHGEPRVIEDVSQDPDHFTGVDSAISFRTRNLLGVPMKTHTRTIGVVQAVNKINNEKFTDEDIILLRTLASQAGIAIENARLFQQSDFIAEMVHELRTPLSALKISSNLLRRTDLPSEQRTEIADTMVNETERLIRLTDDFLNIARLESGREQLEVSAFELNALLREAVSIVQAQAKDKNIEIRCEPTDLTAEADRGKVKQVLLNLLTNAIKYNRQNGHIYLQSRAVTEQNQHFIQISVADTGFGIPRQYQKNMFQKFYRVPSVEKSQRGTGLGLAICKHIVEAHGGTITVTSEENVGSTFRFTIPLSD